MKKVCLDVLGCRALGDTLAVTPTLRKLYNSYGKKISVATHHTEIFKNNPYVDNIFNEITEDIKNDYEVFNSFNIGYHPNGVCYKHNAMDIRQFHAVNLGFMLTKDEMSMDYFPDEVESIEGLPEKYVLITCSKLEFKNMGCKKMANVNKTIKMKEVLPLFLLVKIRQNLVVQMWINPFLILILILV